MAPGTPPPSYDPSNGGTAPARRSVRGGPPAQQAPATPRGATPTATRASAGSRGGAAASGTGRASTRRKGLIDYPRHGKTGVRRWLPSWKVVLGAFLTFLLLGVGAFAYAYSSTKIPTPADLVDAQTTTVYYSDAATVMGKFSEQNRVLVEEATIPDHVKNAVVAAEDRTFYENPGINPAGIVRALWNNLRGNDRQGGSSITQQYAERFYSDTTINDYKGKVREAILAVKLARAQDKTEILGNYLNTIYFGRDSYGIETASQAYFGVGVADLTVSQAALIAGIIPSPNNWDPRIDPERAEQRWNYVLDGMVETGTLTQAERDEQVFPETIEFAPPETYRGPAGHLLRMVRDEILANAPITDTDLDQAGYKIVTTIDTGLQQAAVDAVATLPEGHSPDLKTALVTLDPATGAIVSLYGGADYLERQRNNVTQDGAQAGSTFKPFALVANLEAGNSLKSRYEGTNRIPVEGFEDGVRNFSDQTFGELDVVEATAQSVNAVYAQMNLEVGPEATLDVARRAGVCANGATAADQCPVLDGQQFISNVLGTASPHPIDMAQSFNTFAAQGMRTEPFIVRSVEYLRGGLVYEGGTDPARAFEQDVMADTTYALSQVVEHPRGTARKAQAVGHPVAGKTGTSNENRSAWFVGYTGHLTTAVALYQVGPDNAEQPITGFAGTEFVTGGSFPLDIWTAYMTTAMAGREVIQFPPPADVGEPNTPPIVAIPNVIGMSEGEALGALGAAGFSAVVQRANDPAAPEGTVFQQSPTGEAEQGSQVTIIVSDGPGTVVIPNVVGMSSGDAQAALAGAGFAVAVQQEEDPAPADQVIGQNPGGGTEGEPGSTVTIIVSTGPPEPEPGPPPGPPGREEPVDPTPTPGEEILPIPEPPGNGGGGGNGGG